MSPRNLRALVLLTGLLALSTLSAPGQAAERNEFVNEGAYIMLAGLTAFEGFQNDGGQNFDTSLGFNIRGGYRFTPILAAEVSADFISGWDTIADLSAAGGPANAQLTLDGGNVTLNALAYFPLGRFQPYALFGMGGMWTRLRSTNAIGTTCTPGLTIWYCSGVYAGFGSDGGFVMKFGGGTDFYVTESWALTVDFAYVLPVGAIEDLRYYNLGWGVRFHF